MQLPTPPTDNLYKLMAIAGLWIIAYVITGSALLVDHHLKLVEALEVENAGLVAETEATKEAQRARVPGVVDSLGAARHATDIAKLAEGIAVHRVRIAAVERRLQLIRPVPFVALIAALVGLAASVAGFWLWYVRVQVPMDSRGKADSGSEMQSPSTR